MTRNVGPFKTREAAVDCAVSRSPAPAYSDLKTRQVRLQCSDYAWGRLYVSEHLLRCKDGQKRPFYFYEVGA